MWMGHQVTISYYVQPPIKSAVEVNVRENLLLEKLQLETELLGKQLDMRQYKMLSALQYCCMLPTRINILLDNAS